MFVLSSHSGRSVRIRRSPIRCCPTRMAHPLRHLPLIIPTHTRPPALLPAHHPPTSPPHSYHIQLWRPSRILPFPLSFPSYFRHGEDVDGEGVSVIEDAGEGRAVGCWIPCLGGFWAWNSVGGGRVLDETSGGDFVNSYSTTVPDIFTTCVRLILIKLRRVTIQAYKSSIREREKEPEPESVCIVQALQSKAS